MTANPLAAFYRPTQRKFSPLTRADMQRRAGMTEREARDTLAKMCMGRLASREGTDQTPGSGIYFLTPKGEAAALDWLALAERKINATPRE